MRWGKWPILDLFSVLGWSFRAPKGDHVLTIFPMFLVFLCIFSPHNTTQHTHHTTRISLCFLRFSVFFHNTQPHTHNTHNTPATDRDLESGLSKSNTRKNPRKCLKKAESGETLARARADADRQIVRLRRSDERPIEPSGNWFPPNFPSFSRKKTND